MAAARYNSGVQHCIETNTEWLKKELSREKFTVAETEEITVCADRYYRIYGGAILGFFGVFMAVVIVMIVLGGRNNKTRVPKRAKDS